MAQNNMTNSVEREPEDSEINNGSSNSKSDNYSS